MSTVNPIWLEAQRKRWQRHDWRLWVKLEAHHLVERPQEKSRAEAAADQAKADAAFLTELEALRADHARVRIELADVKFALALRRIFHKYSPNQPRDDRGRWTDSGQGAITGDGSEIQGSSGSQDNALGSNNPRSILDVVPQDDLSSRTLVAENDRSASYSVDLTKEHSLGGHAINEHVAKSDAYLKERVRDEASRIIDRGDDFRGLSVGSFSSLDSATRLVNSTIAQNKEAVDRVARGDAASEFFSARFSSPTGREAYLRTFHTEPYMRETYGVDVFVVRDPRADKGWRVQSAFPVR